MKLAESTAVGGHRNRPQRAVLFDCDGTLVDSEPLGDKAWARVCRLLRLGEPQPAPRGLSFSDRVLADLGPLPREEVARLYRLYWEELSQLYMHELRPVPEMEALAVDLDARGVRIAIVSNSDDYRVAFTVRCALPRLRHVPTFTASEFIRPKPAPDLFLLAARALGVSPGRCIVVEDSSVGVSAAIAAGMTVVEMVSPAGAARQVASLLTSQSAEPVRGEVDAMGQGEAGSD